MSPNTPILDLRRRFLAVSIDPLPPRCAEDRLGLLRRVFAIPSLHLLLAKVVCGTAAEGEGGGRGRKEAKFDSSPLLPRGRLPPTH